MTSHSFSIAITGAASFIGRHLVRRLSSCPGLDLRLLIHDHHLDVSTDTARVTQIHGDLLRRETLNGFLVPDCTVINLAYLGAASERKNLEAVTNLAEVCLKAHVRRLVHCSTAVVVGRTLENTITEDIRCEPVSDYELAKFKMEELLIGKTKDSLDLVVLRPTAVFGPGGKNLLKMAGDLVSGNRCVNYLRSCLFSDRRMNLVAVDNVVSALIFLACAEKKWGGDIFIISDDDHAGNNYRDVEKFVARKFGYKDCGLPIIPLPKFLLAIILKLTGKTNVNPSRIYDSGKIQDAGFRKTIPFDVALSDFADWHKQQQGIDIDTGSS